MDAGCPVSGYGNEEVACRPDDPTMQLSSRKGQEQLQCRSEVEDTQHSEL